MLTAAKFRRQPHRFNSSSSSTAGGTCKGTRCLCTRIAHHYAAPRSMSAVLQHHTPGFTTRSGTHILLSRQQHLLATCSARPNAQTATTRSRSDASSQGSSNINQTEHVAVLLHAARQAQQQSTFLQELRISDFALVPSAHVSWRPGLNAISGQSGAGKSVLIDALAQLLGAPADAECVRPPADTATIEGTWQCGPGVAASAAQLLADMGLPSKALPGVWCSGRQEAVLDTHSKSSAGVIHIRREICRTPAAGSPSGGAAVASAAATRSRVLINGSPSSLRVLRALGGLLVDVNGQHASLALRDSNQQLQLLDKIAGTSALAAELASKVAQLSDLEFRLSQTDALADEAERTALQKRVELIDSANIIPGEELQLRRRLKALQARRTCLESAATVQAGIAGEASSSSTASLTDALRIVMGQLRDVISSEEQQLRLVAQERQQRQQQQAAGSNGNGKLTNSSSSSYGTVDQNSDTADDDSSSAEEAASRAAAVKALRASEESLVEAGAWLEEAQAQLRTYANVAGYSPVEASQLTARLDEIEKLTKRFKVRGSSELLGLAQTWSDQLEQYYESLGQQEVWRSQSATLQAEVSQSALQLSSARRAAAGRLAAAVQSCLSQLAMSSSRFEVDITWTPAGQADQQAGPSSRAMFAPTAAQPQSLLAVADECTTQQPDNSSSTALYKLSSSGLDHVTFLLSAGPAEPLRPLSATASGGEAARIMLALKAAPAAAAAVVHHTPADAGCTGSTTFPERSSSSSSSSGGGGIVSVGPPVLVMDELDAGLGSRLGEPVGRLLAGLVGAGGKPTAACQVLVVTHTPQVAAHASHHIQVVKGAADDGRVVTTFKHLATAEERQAELADMLGLGPEEGAQLAAELLAAAHPAAVVSASVTAAANATHARSASYSNEVDTHSTEVHQQEQSAIGIAMSQSEDVADDECVLSASQNVSSNNTIGNLHGPSGALATNDVAATSVPNTSQANSLTAGEQSGYNHSIASEVSPNVESATNSREWLQGLTAATAAAGIAASTAEQRTQYSGD